MAMIERETAHAQAGRPARIVAKMNALTDTRIIGALSAASQAGVTIDLIVRGISCLRPGIPNATDRINVISVVGRFLEHSRIFYFENGGETEVYLSSADWMERNLEARVETTFPIADPRLKSRLVSELTQIMLKDTVKAHVLGPDGIWRRQTPASTMVDSQKFFLNVATVFQY